jgi:hypothetical protein
MKSMAKTPFKSLISKNRNQSLHSIANQIGETFEFESKLETVKEINEQHKKISRVSSVLFNEIKEREKIFIPFFHHLNHIILAFQQNNEHEWKENSFQKSKWKKQKIEWNTFQALWSFSRNWLEDEGLRMKSITYEVETIEKRLDELLLTLTSQEKKQISDALPIQLLLQSTKEQLIQIPQENQFLIERINHYINRVNEFVEFTNIKIAHGSRLSTGIFATPEKKQFDELFKHLRSIQSQFSNK